MYTWQQLTNYYQRENYLFAQSKKKNGDPNS